MPHSLMAALKSVLPYSDVWYLRPHEAFQLCMEQTLSVGQTYEVAVQHYGAALRGQSRWCDRPIKIIQP